ncbi:MAG: VCBS repeat-containing protein [Holophagales bacterium]|nr:VCBS repeat-containing protein [Holophagales bacterium]
MFSPIESELPRPVPAFFLAVLAAALLLASPLAGQTQGSSSAAAQAQDNDGAASRSDGGAERGPEGGDAAAEPTAVDPDDPWAGKTWYYDEELGRRYIIEKIPKVARTYRWESDTRIRLPGGLRVEVVDHDPSSFWVKLYEPQPLRSRTEEPKGPSEEELKKIAETYETDLEEVDRIRMVPFDKGLPKSGQWRNGFDIADMDGDGHLDIVFGPSRKGRSRPNIFLGNSEGEWRRWLTASYPNLAYDYGDAEAGDWNGDGHMDLAFGVHLRGMLALVGDGKGRFRAWTEGIQFDVPGQGGDASSFSSRAIASLDWNGDGRLDLIALGEGPKGSRRTIRKEGSGEKGLNSSKGFVVYINEGDGKWRAGRLEEHGVDFGDDFAFGDVDGDGVDEIVVASRIQGNRHLLRKVDPGGLATPMEIDSLRPFAFVTAVELADLDGDGRADLIAGYRNREAGVWRTGIDIFYSREDGWQRRPLLALPDSFKGISSMAVGEFDGEEGVDLVVTTGEAEVWLFPGDGEGYFLREMSPEGPSPIKGCHGYNARLVDLDGDGRDELIVGFAGEPTSTFGPLGTRYPGCPGQGRVAAWKLAPTAPEPAESGSQPGS